MIAKLLQFFRSSNQVKFLLFAYLSFRVFSGLLFERFGVQKDGLYRNFYECLYI